MMKRGKSPYVTCERRLADVIAAIQAMGSYPWATRKIEKWAEGLGGQPWLKIFDDHPEFFRLKNDEYATLRWRHAYDRSYDPEHCRNLSTAELKDLSKEERRERLTRQPLDADQIGALMKTAVELHSSAIAHSQELRWWVPTAFGLFGVLVGALVTLLGTT